MAANEYLSLREWSAAVEHLCVARLHRPLTEMPAVTTEDMEDAWREGVTPEEYYTTDIESLFDKARRENK